MEDANRSGTIWWPEPYSPEVMAHIRQFSERPSTRAHLSECPLFGQAMRADLVRMLGGDQDAVHLIEAHCLLGAYGDATYCRKIDRDVWKLLNRQGIKRPRGKRARPELVEMVGDLVGLLQALGVPLTRNKGGPMTATILKVLEAVHAELQMDGDPRNEYRRLLRLERDARTGKAGFTAW